MNECAEGRREIGSIGFSNVRARSDVINLQRELVENLDCLFVFVEQPAVDPTNNLSPNFSQPET